MLVFEDIHWADASLLDLIEVLGARTQDVPLLFVALARPELFADRAGLGRRAHLVHGALARAARRPRRGAARRRLLPAGARTELRGRLAAAAEGNPLFIEELAAVVAERCRRPISTTLPTTIRSILAARLDALEPDERSILLDAAVVGKIFWRGLLERLERGARARRVARRARGARADPARGRLAHPGRRAVHLQARPHAHVAYATVPRARRRERHAEVAALPRGDDDRDGRVGGDARPSTGARPATTTARCRTSCRRRPRGPGLGEGARLPPVQRGLHATAGRRRAPPRVDRKRAIAFQALLPRARRGAASPVARRRSVNVRVAPAARRFVLEREVGRRDVADDLPDRVGVARARRAPRRAGARSPRRAPRTRSRCRPCRRRRRGRGCAPRRSRETARRRSPSSGGRCSASRSRDAEFPLDHVSRHVLPLPSGPPVQR